MTLSIACASIARTHLEIIAAKISQLTGLRDELARMVACRGTGKVRDCRVIEVLRDQELCAHERRQVCVDGGGGRAEQGPGNAGRRPPSRPTIWASPVKALATPPRVRSSRPSGSSTSLSSPTPTQLIYIRLPTDRSCIVQSGRAFHARAHGVVDLNRFLALLLVWTAALALPLVAVPSARAMATTPCPMEASGMTAVDHAEMGCCDHGQGSPDQTAPCKPGMACFATAAALPAGGVDLAIITFDSVEPIRAPTRTLASLPPDRDIRPPIAL
ncbi:MAG: hypothetical protein K9G59_15790 [Caulobacter sp.]|nr:hypothetical protein [Caulobacter sp.]